MKRVVSVLAAMAIMAAMMVVTASAAFADPKVYTGQGSKNKGAEVYHCGPFFEQFYIEGVKGNEVTTPTENIGGRGFCYDG